MSIFKIIVIIVAVWIILKVKNFISGIQITSNKSVIQEPDKSRKSGMDIEDAYYEDIE